MTIWINVQVNHITEGIMIEWLSSPNQEIKSSIFVPMVRILHINVDEQPFHTDDDDELPKGIIEK